MKPVIRSSFSGPIRFQFQKHWPTLILTGRKSPLSKSQNTVIIIIYWILVFKKVARTCFFDLKAAPMTAELLENPIRRIFYAIVVLASIPTDQWSKIALVNGFLRLGRGYFLCGF
jgi:hypothetical protein